MAPENSPESYLSSEPQDPLDFPVRSRISGRIAALLTAASLACSQVMTETGGLSENPNADSSSQADTPNEAEKTKVQQKISQFDAYDNFGLTILESKLEPTRRPELLNDEQKQILTAAIALPQEFLFALAMKESMLNPGADDGYMQLTQTALDDIERIFTGHAQLHLDPSEPSHNLALSRVYLNLIYYIYIDVDSRFEDLALKDKARLIKLMYNMGPTAVKRLWDEYEVKDVDSLLDAMLFHVSSRLGLSHSTGSQWDETYAVEVPSHPAMDFYLQNPNDPQLAAQALSGRSYPSLKKFLISTRYVQVTDAIESVLRTKSYEEYLEQVINLKFQLEDWAVPNKELHIKGTEWMIYTVGKGDTLYSLAEDHGVSQAFLKSIFHDHFGTYLSEEMKLGQEILLPSLNVYSQIQGYFYEGTDGTSMWIKSTKNGFWSTVLENPGYRDYISTELEEVYGLNRNAVQQAIIEFNRRFNPELSQINDEATNIPKGAYIWIPNAEFIADWYKGTIGVKGKKAIDVDELPVEITQKPVETEVIPASKKLTKTHEGQYVLQLGENHYQRDLEMMREGAISFQKQNYEDHPDWQEVGNLRRSTLNTIRGKRVKLKLEKVKYIVLHSTISRDSSGTVRGKKAHFVIERNGRIKHLVSVKKSDDPENKVPPHAGFSMWNGDENLNKSSIGIEVVALAQQEWTDEQYQAVSELVEWLGGYFELQKRDVVTHSQIAYGRYGRGRKSDPYSKENSLFVRLGLPNNFAILDLDVANGNVKANTAAIERDKNFTSPWAGLEAASSMD